MFQVNVVPFDEGRCTIRHTLAHTVATIIEDYFNGHAPKTTVTCQKQSIELQCQQNRNDQILEWIEFIYKDQPC